MTVHPYFPQESNFSERRYHPRWRVENRLLYKLENNEQFRQGFTRDISCTGACIRVPDHLFVNEKLKVTIYLTESESVTLDAKVAWVNEHHKEIRAGVSFIDLPEEAQSALLDHAFEVHPDQVVKNWFKGWEEKLDPTNQ